MLWSIENFLLVTVESSFIRFFLFKPDLIFIDLIAAKSVSLEFTRGIAVSISSTSKEAVSKAPRAFFRQFLWILLNLSCPLPWVAKFHTSIQY